jgi:hypothetical protein
LVAGCGKSTVNALHGIFLVENRFRGAHPPVSASAGKMPFCANGQNDRARQRAEIRKTNQ